MEDTVEPADWNAAALDNTYNFNGTAGIFLDDLIITEL
ncbi:MAG: hypothetical protein ACJAXA_002884 [Candidatus Aldehydirespiratoraceae bacterium]